MRGMRKTEKKKRAEERRSVASSLISNRLDSNKRHTCNTNAVFEEGARGTGYAAKDEEEEEGEEVRYRVMSRDRIEAEEQEQEEKDFSPQS